MPRKKQFAIDDVKQKAMLIFWDQGYRGTSLQDLVETMGINRASLYDTFGDKYALFIETLHNYNDTYAKPFFTKIRKANSPRQAIIALFDEICDGISKGEEQNGCYIVNTALEMSPHDEKVSKIVNRIFAYVEKNFFRKMILQGQARGEISQAVIPDTTARTLLSLLIGLRVLSRNRPDQALLNSFKTQVAALLPPNTAIPHPVSQSRRRRTRSQVFRAVAHVA
ncbi:MAG: TetR/AcrR family transcriptional regulator [Nitrospira sp.]|nr:TetR/AcrR family transcriptional regulator [Nitrospira sp.]MCY3955904.1 TetR/AcrR family transcriptional regulator [Nitrospira sp.]MCY4131416.1 TetR/AcrR family transcriptional regulator [Nitrospira sp.]